jgi:hypothetical protein
VSRRRLPERTVRPESAPPWPALPKHGFIAGRAATQQDVTDGNALFVAEVGGRLVGRPLPITVPQYAFHIDQTTGARTRVIVLQAERAGSLEMIGYHAPDTNTYGVGTAPEFELLGTTPVAGSTPGRGGRPTAS